MLTYDTDTHRKIHWFHHFRQPAILFERLSGFEPLSGIKIDLFETTSKMDLTKFSIQRWLYLVMSSLIMGCNSEDTPTISNYMIVEIDGNEFTYADENLSVNENCNFIFINGATAQVDDKRFRLGFQLTKSGKISEIYCLDFSVSGIAAPDYRSADFLSSEVFFINNFEYSESEGTLSFDFDGVLYELDKKESSKRISGRVETNQLQFIDCSISPRQIAATIDQQPFESVEIEGETVTTTESQGQIISIESSWVGISDDGFKISILTSAELEDMTIGTYSFSENSSKNRVTLEKYEGVYEAVIFEDRNGAWKEFVCRGEFRIEQKVNDSVVGIFSLKAYKNDEVIYTITNGTFSI